MAHLPDPTVDLDDALASSDPVVRAPRAMVSLPEPQTLPTRMLVGISAIALAVGATLGGAGIAIVFATRVPSAHAARGGLHAHAGPTVVAADAGATTFALTPPADGGTDAGALAPVLAPTGPEAHDTVTQHRLGRGKTLAQILRQLGVPNDLAAHVAGALRPLLDMRSLQPSDTLAVMRDPAHHGEIRRVEYRRSDTQVWAVSVAPDLTCTAERIEVVKTDERLLTGFTVGDSLENTLASARLQADILPRLQEVFTALDLGRELRRGDTVRLVVNEERLNGSFFRYGRIEAIDYRGAMGAHRAYFQRLGAHGGDFFDAHGTAPDRGPLRAPLAAPRMTSSFNLHRMHPVLHRVMPHMGTDFGAPVGTPVYAAADGEVLTVAGGGPTGNLVRLAHPALGIETGYAHLSRFAPGLHAGAHVRVHQLLGYVGSTGRSTGPHLHFACKRHDQFFDCMTLFLAHRSVPAAQREAFDQTVAQRNAELDGIRVDGATATPPAPTSPPEDAPPSGDDPPADEESDELN